MSPPAETWLRLFRQLDVSSLRKSVPMPIKDAWKSGRGRCAWSCFCHLVIYFVAVSGWGKCVQLRHSSSSCAWLLPPTLIIIIILVVRFHPVTWGLFFETLGLFIRFWGCCIELKHNSALNVGPFRSDLLFADPPNVTGFMSVVSASNINFICESSCNWTQSFCFGIVFFWNWTSCPWRVN